MTLILRESQVEILEFIQDTWQVLYSWIKGPHHYHKRHLPAGYKLALLTAVESLYRDYKKPFLGEASLVWALAGWKKSVFFI